MAIVPPTKDQVAAIARGYGMHPSDAALRSAGAQPQADATATDLEMAPAQ